MSRGTGGSGRTRGTINVGNGAQLLTYDDRGLAPDPLGIPAAVDNQSSPTVKWKPGMSYRDVTTTASGSGTGLKVDIVTDTEGNPTARLNTRGTGYVDNETITIQDPDKKGGDITIQVNGLMARGGDIVLRAERSRFSVIYETAVAGVTLTNATLKGRDVAILRTMGATRGAMMRVFLITGASIGVVGTLAGLVLGITFCLNIEAIRALIAWMTSTTIFDPNVYYLTRLPADMDVRETASIVGMALALSVLATLYPSWRASTLDPVEALRYE